MWDETQVDGFLTDLTENVNIYVNCDRRFSVKSVKSVNRQIDGRQVILTLDVTD